MTGIVWCLQPPNDSYLASESDDLATFPIVVVPGTPHPHQAYPRNGTLSIPDLVSTFPTNPMIHLSTS